VRDAVPHGEQLANLRAARWAMVAGTPRTVMGLVVFAEPAAAYRI